jgi:AraC-like DNA-binding protein
MRRTIRPSRLALRYAEYPPDPRLALCVKCFWVFESDVPAGEADDERVVPDGNPEMIFHYGESFSAVSVDATVAAIATRQPGCLFAGQITQPLVLRPNGNAGMISVRFTPWGARLLLDLPMHETTDRWIALDTLPDRWLDRVEGEIRECTTDRQRIALIEAALLARAERTASRADTTVISCARRLLQTHGRARLDQLGTQSGLGERQLERRFNEAIGVPPKLLASILRFRALFDALNDDSQSPWLAAAIDTGYFDQAHMIRDFRRFAGQPPQAFYRSLTGFSAAMVNIEVR